MANEEEKLKEFSNLVRNYRNIIAQDYHQRQGDDEDTATPCLAIIKAFEGSTELKVKMLKIVLKDFSAEKRGKDHRWDALVMSDKLSLLATLIEKL